MLTFGFLDLWLVTLSPLYQGIFPSILWRSCKPFAFEPSETTRRQIKNFALCCSLCVWHLSKWQPTWRRVAWLWLRLRLQGCRRNRGWLMGDGRWAMGDGCGWRCHANVWAANDDVVCLSRWIQTRLAPRCLSCCLFINEFCIKIYNSSNNGTQRTLNGDINERWCVCVGQVNVPVRRFLANDSSLRPPPPSPLCISAIPSTSVRWFVRA